MSHQEMVLPKETELRLLCPGWLHTASSAGPVLGLHGGDWYRSVRMLNSRCNRVLCYRASDNPTPSPPEQPHSTFTPIL